MAAIDQTTLRASLIQAIAAQDPSLATRLGEDQTAELDLIAITAALAAAADELIGDAVAAARRSDASWARIGAVLGISRQAAQQRFGETEPTPWAEYGPEAPQPPAAMRLTPITTATEMTELDRVGHQGWHSVEVGADYHGVARSDVPWEHERTTLFERPRKTGTNWQRIGTQFPFVYYARPTT
jgi:hypothetical protein